MMCQSAIHVQRALRVNLQNVSYLLYVSFQRAHVKRFYVATCPNLLGGYLFMRNFFLRAIIFTHHLFLRTIFLRSMFLRLYNRSFFYQ